MLSMAEKVNVMVILMLDELDMLTMVARRIGLLKFRLILIGLQIIGR